MRLFVAARPPEPIRARLRAVARPDLAGVRWVPEERWHVTLRFLGELDDPAPVARAVAAAAVGAVPPTATLGSRVERLGGVAVVPVAGLAALAGAVGAATSARGRPPEDRPFRGHVTLARGRGRRPVPAGAVGGEVAGGTWVVDELAVVRSHLGAEARDEVLAVVPVGQGRR